jgi:parallel beta-helix repeat protein
MMGMSVLRGTVVCDAGSGVQVNVKNLCIVAGDRGFALDVCQGEPIVKGCWLRGFYVSEAGIPIRIQGKGTAPTIQKCKISQGMLGVAFTRGAGGLLRENDIHGHASNGVRIDEGSNPSVTKNRIYNCNQSGVVVRGGGTTGTVSDNKIYGHGHARTGVEIGKGSNPSVTKNRIYDSIKIASTTGTTGSEVVIEMQPLGVSGDFAYRALQEYGTSEGANPAKEVRYFLRRGEGVDFVKVRPPTSFKKYSRVEERWRRQNALDLEAETRLNLGPGPRLLPKALSTVILTDSGLDERKQTFIQLGKDCWAWTRNSDKLVCVDASDAVHAERVRRSKALANLRGKTLSFSRRFCWLYTAPKVSLTSADGVRTVLRGPANGGWAGVWGATHTMQDVKRAFEQARSLYPGQTAYYFAGDGKEQVPDGQLLFHHMVAGSEVRFKELTCLIWPAHEPCTITVRKVDGDEQRFEMNTNNTVADVKLAYEKRRHGPSRWAQEYSMESENEPSADERKLHDCAEHTFLLVISEGSDADERQAQAEAEEWVKEKSATDDVQAMNAEAAVDAFPLTCWEALFYEGCVRFVRCCCGCSVASSHLCGVGGMALFSWLCVAGAVQGSMGGISDFGMVALVALVLGISAGPSVMAVVALNAWRNNGSMPFPYRHLFYSPLFSGGNVLHDGDTQSIKAHWIVGGGYRHDKVEHSRADTSTLWGAFTKKAMSAKALEALQAEQQLLQAKHEVDPRLQEQHAPQPWQQAIKEKAAEMSSTTAVEIRIVGCMLLRVLGPFAILTFYGWVSGVMLAAGARCVHSGELCGAGGYSGGVAMLLFGGFGPVVLVFGWIGGELGFIAGLFIYTTTMCVFMVVAGSVCIHSGGESPLCGPGGEVGGIIMLLAGLSSTITVVYLPLRIGRRGMRKGDKQMNRAAFRVAKVRNWLFSNRRHGFVQL